MIRKEVRRWSKEMMPPLLVLFFTIAFYAYFGDITFVEGWEEGIYRVLLRFFRFAFFLCLPLYVLLPVYSFIVDKMRGSLLQTEKAQLYIHPIKHWIFRPFQGIGIGLLFETKLLTTLQLVTGITTNPLLFPPGHFQLGRLLVVSGITVVVSLLLSVLWTLDDMGIRYVNRKDQEIKMIGKYVGTLMPIIFGFYGIFNLVASFPKVQVFIYVFKTIVILYPPFAVFAVFHRYFLERKVGYFLPKGAWKKGGIWQEGE